MTPSPSLGRLTVVPPRDVWPHEAHDFTPWLLQNVDVLSDLLGMDLALEVAEHHVGDFRLDLLGKDEATGRTVIVENQLEVSNHDHLGQILTYAAGTDPTTIVWIAARFRPEHRAALDWLNERTNEDTRFFGVEIEVVRIGDSTPAPAFKLVAQPNDWEKQVRTSTSGGAGVVSERRALYREFWETLLERIKTEHPQWTRARTTDQSWCNTASGTGAVNLSMAFRGDGLVMQIYFESPNADLNMTRFENLRAKRDLFEATWGARPIWDEMPNRKAARVVVVSDEYKDVADRGQWPNMTDWLIDQQIRVRKAVSAVGGL